MIEKILAPDEHLLVLDFIKRCLPFAGISVFILVFSGLLARLQSLRSRNISWLFVLGFVACPLGFFIHTFRPLSFPPVGSNDWMFYIITALPILVLLEALAGSDTFKGRIVLPVALVIA